MTANESLAFQIVASMPTNGKTPIKAWPLVAHEKFIGTLHNRDAWRSHPLDAEENKLGSHLITELTAYIFSDGPVAARYKKCVNTIEAGMKKYPIDYSAVICAVLRSYRSFRTFKKSSLTELQDVVSVLVAFETSVFVAVLLYAQLSYDILGDKGDGVTQDTYIIPIIANKHITMLYCNPSFIEKKYEMLQKLHILSLTEAFLNIGMQSILGKTKIVPSQIVDMIQEDHLFLIGQQYAAWPVLTMVSGTNILVKGHEIGPMSYTHAMDTSWRSVIAGKEVAAGIIQSFFKNMPQTHPPMETYNEIMSDKKYMMWSGITDVEWKEQRLDNIIIYYDEPDNMMYASMQSDADMTGLDDSAFYPDVLPIQYFLKIPSLNDLPRWQEIQSDYEAIRKAVEKESDAFNEYGVVAEVIRMCLVSREKKIIQGSKRVPAGSVSGTRRPTKKDIAVTYLPRHQYIREDSEANVVGMTTRHHASPIMHMVTGFIRQLTSGIKVSENAQELEVKTVLRSVCFFRVLVYRRYNSYNIYRIAKYH